MFNTLLEKKLKHLKLSFIVHITYIVILFGKVP